MLHKKELISSGNPLVESTWGGFYRGGTYFLTGRKKSGKTLSALQFMQAGVNENHTILYFTSSRPKDLIINAAAIDIDLQDYIARNIVTLIRVSPPKNISSLDDSYFKEYLLDVEKVVDQYKPSLLIFDELTPFISFKDLHLLKETFLELMEFIEAKSITSLYLLSDPVTQAAKNAVNVLIEQSTGYITLEKEEGNIKKDNPGLMRITPNVGHLEGEYDSKYYIQPLKGLSLEFLMVENSLSVEESLGNYTPLTHFEIPKVQIPSINIYSLEEFKLLLNNQIAYYNTTGEIFTLVSIKLGEIVQKNNLLTINQLANAVRLSIEKKDKICVVEDKILVIFPKEDKNIKLLVSMIISNLPNNRSNIVDKISPFIFLFSVRMDDSFKDSNDLLEKLSEINKPDKNNIVLN